MSFQLSAVIPQQNPLACSYPRPYGVIPSEVEGPALC